MNSYDRLFAEALADAKALAAERLGAFKATPTGGVVAAFGGAYARALKQGRPFELRDLRAALDQLDATPPTDPAPASGPQKREAP